LHGPFAGALSSSMLGTLIRPIRHALVGSGNPAQGFSSKVCTRL
jgi:hypothetical protein